jgi:hypothetical protein
MILKQQFLDFLHKCDFAQSFLTDLGYSNQTIEKSRTSQDLIFANDSRKYYQVLRDYRFSLKAMIEEYFLTKKIDTNKFSDIKESIFDFVSNKKNCLTAFVFKFVLRDINSQILYLESVADFDTDSTELLNDQKVIDLDYSTALAFNKIASSLLSFLNQIDTFDVADDINQVQILILQKTMTNIKNDFQQLLNILQIEIEAQNTNQKIDSNKIFLDYTITTLPVDIATKAIDLLNLRNEGCKTFCFNLQEALLEDIKDFYSYLVNLERFFSSLVID